MGQEIITTERDYYCFKLRWLGRVVKPLAENKKHRRRRKGEVTKLDIQQQIEIQDSGSVEVKVRVINLGLIHTE